MTEFAGRTAVVTGGGSGMGRELVAEACNVAMCDVSPTGLAETQRLCEAAGLPQGLRVTTHIADVADRTQVERFRDEVADRHQTEKIHLLFNNAGISGGGSMITNSSDEWERTFNICWGGVYNCSRAFLPMLQNAEESHIVNTSSINGFWASVGPRIPHTAYSAAKFAVKGFTEALITGRRGRFSVIGSSPHWPGGTGISNLRPLAGWISALERGRFQGHKQKRKLKSVAPFARNRKFESNYRLSRRIKKLQVFRHSGRVGKSVLSLILSPQKNPTGPEFCR
jgi:NAD(P)-dependent dehydrogenase (short-subunit alcohol dehydrogenase family)